MLRGRSNFGDKVSERKKVQSCAEEINSPELWYWGDSEEFAKVQVVGLLLKV